MGPIGLETIAGVLVTIVAGKVTPLSCYVGLAGSSGSAVELAQPNGSLGCEYDMERIRIFIEHQSSPASGSDSPGFNHAGIKYLQPLGKVVTAYAGASIAMASEQHHLDNPLVIAGVETNGDLRLYAEHINSIAKPSDGHTVLGIKIMF
jgi:hypothetical protein